ncbi:MAG: hypothetical protein GWM90_15570, partial [Gemmatimonadetes bacterium]|nr:hypothetical protein [Gemmatimonadota bacterium]NIQ55624.1 hypothetical protein [Gemmatimonadota bacterium]NIU75833.1 hypothetical protein [Gammaproteobacteria bacterium]NIX45469.1 hypothetical protein [Gemmatimonadota bacterium]NIY12784.1 hypothetical protein [Gemmatimonadota bacterium]
ARLDLRGPSWHLGAGDVFLASDAFVGPMQHGRGAELSVEHQEVEGRVLVATPSSYGPLQVDGHLVRAAGALETPYGRVGIRFSAVDRRTDLFEDHAAVGGGLTWDLRRAGHRLDAEAGFVRVRSDSAARAGLAGGARYRVEWAGGAVTARVRTTPGTTRGATSYGREAFLSAMVGLAPSVAVTGWGFLTAAPLVSGAPYPTSRGGAGGLRLDLPVGGTADLGAGVRRADEVGDTLGPDLTRFVQAGIDLPLGPAHLEADLDVGRVTGENDRRYANLRTGVRWHARSQWAWVGISRYDDGLGRPLSLLEVSGAVDLRATRLQAGVTLPVAGGAGQRPSLWSGAEIPLSGDYDLLTGIDYGGIAVDRARVSLGVRRRIGLPLPLPRTPVLEGTVFDDRNGDGRRGPEEPPLAGVELRLGALHATSDEDGRFRFYESGGGPLRIPASGLPRGALVPADVHLPSTGTVDVPVIRTATLEVEAFLDRDGDRVMDEAEDRAGGVLVSVVDDRRRTRDAVADADGRVRFGSLRPGRYTVRIHRGRSGAPPFETTVTIEPGSRVRLVIAVPLRGREIRLPGGASLERSTRP